MPVVSQFRAALRARNRVGAALDLLPTRLTQAAAEVLDVEGVGISLFTDRLRLPIGASSAAATTAERAQFTQGEGPCLEAITSGAVIAATETSIPSRWPGFAHVLLGNTPYRSVMAIPLDLLPTRAAIDLYFLGPDAGLGLSMVDVMAIASEIRVQLLHQAAGSPPVAGPAARWLDGPLARSRVKVWPAIGMMIAAHGMPAPDALDCLRAYAYAQDRDVDDIAVDLLELRIDPVDVEVGT